MKGGSFRGEDAVRYPRPYRNDERSGVTKHKRYAGHLPGLKLQSIGSQAAEMGVTRDEDCAIDYRC